MQLLSDGRFTLGLGAGENLNEHIIGGQWPLAGVRHEMLREAVEIIRALRAGGNVTYRGKHFDVESARVSDLPDTASPIGIAVSGPASCRLAGRHADAIIAVEARAELAFAAFRSASERDRGHRGPRRVPSNPAVALPLDLAHQVHRPSRRCISPPPGRVRGLRRRPAPSAPRAPGAPRGGDRRRHRRLRRPGAATCAPHSPAGQRGSPEQRRIEGARPAIGRLSGWSGPRLPEPGGPRGMLSHAPPTAAAPSPITTIFSPFFRQSPTRVTDE